MPNDALLALLTGARPVNAASFMDPFASYDIAGMVTRGLKYLSVGNRMVVGGGGYANQWDNITGAAPVQYQPNGQTGTLTKKTDSYLGGGPTRPSIEWSDHTDLKTSFSTNFLPSTGEFWNFGAITPLKGTCQLWGQGSDTAKARLTMVNTEIRFALASSGSGGYSLFTSPDGANLINRSLGYMVGRRASDNKLVVRHLLAGAADWTEVVAASAATTGAGGTGSALTIPGDVNGGAYTVSSGYSPYSRRQVEGWFVGTPSAQDLADIKQIIQMYSGL